MLKHSRFWLAACVVAAALLVFLVGSSGAEGRFFRVVNGALVEFDPQTEAHTGYFVKTFSGDFYELDPDHDYAYSPGQLQTIADLLGGWDKLETFPARVEYDAFRVYREPEWQQPFFRLVDGQLVPLIQGEPQTHNFVQTKLGAVEIDPDLHGPDGTDQLEAIAAAVGGWDQMLMTASYVGPDSDYIQIRKGGNLAEYGDHFYRVVDGRFVALPQSERNTGVFVRFEFGVVEIDPNLPVRPQFDALLGLVRAGAPVIGPEDLGQMVRGPVAVESATWGAVKAAFSR